MIRNIWVMKLVMIAALVTEIQLYIIMWMYNIKFGIKSMQFNITVKFMKIVKQVGRRLLDETVLGFYTGFWSLGFNDGLLCWVFEREADRK